MGVKEIDVDEFISYMHCKNYLSAVDALFVGYFLKHGEDHDMVCLTSDEGNKLYSSYIARAIKGKSPFDRNSEQEADLAYKIEDSMQEFGFYFYGARYVGPLEGVSKIRVISENELNSIKDIEAYIIDSYENYYRYIVLDEGKSNTENIDSVRKLFLSRFDSSDLGIIYTVELKNMPRGFISSDIEVGQSLLIKDMAEYGIQFYFIDDIFVEFAEKFYSGQRGRRDAFKIYEKSVLEVCENGENGIRFLGAGINDSDAGNKVLTIADLGIPLYRRSAAYMMAKYKYAFFLVKVFNLDILSDLIRTMFYDFEHMSAYRFIKLIRDFPLLFAQMSFVPSLWYLCRVKEILPKINICYIEIEGMKAVGEIRYSIVDNIGSEELIYAIDPAAYFRLDSLSVKRAKSFKEKIQLEEEKKKFRADNVKLEEINKQIKEIDGILEKIDAQIEEGNEKLCTIFGEIESQLLNLGKGTSFLHLGNVFMYKESGKVYLAHILNKDSLFSLKVSYLPNIDLHDIQEKVISQREIHKCIPLYFVQNFYEYLQEFDRLCGFEDKLTKSEIETLYNFQDLCYEDFLLASIAHTTDKPRVIEEKSATEYKGFIGMSEDKRIDPTIVSEYNNWSFSEISMRMHVLGMIRSKLPEVYKVIKLESIRRASKFITCGGAPNPYIKGSHVIDIDNNLLTGITDYI